MAEWVKNFTLVIRLRVKHIYTTLNRHVIY